MFASWFTLGARWREQVQAPMARGPLSVKRLRKDGVTLCLARSSFTLDAAPGEGPPGRLAGLHDLVPTELCITYDVEPIDWSL